MNPIRLCIIDDSLDLAMGLGQTIRRIEMTAKVHESLPLLRLEFLQILLRYSAKQEEVSKRWEFLQIDLEPWHFSVMMVEIDFFKEMTVGYPVSEIELIRFSIQNILEYTIHSYTKGVVFRENLDRFVVIMNAVSDDEASVIAEACRNNVKMYSKSSITIGLGGSTERLQGLPDVYNQAVTALSYRFYSEGNVVLRVWDFVYEQKVPIRLSADYQRSLLLSIFSGNKEIVLEELKQLFEQDAGHDPLPPYYVKSSYWELIFSVLRALTEKIPFEKLVVLDQKVKASMSNGMQALKELQELLKEVCMEGCQFVLNHQDFKTAHMVDKALEFIKQRLNDDIIMHDCAAAVYLSTSYFAAIFKKQTGLTFTQYVITARMEQAKEMLAKGHQVQEACSAVGYEDRKYFTETFKKHTGLTPSKYRAQFVR